MTTNVYIDGFNLYYGALKKRWPTLKWLDLSTFCSNLLPTRNINRIRYFTAGVKPTPRDPQIRSRQETYLRALRTLSNVEVHDEGWFVLRQALRDQYPLAYPHGSNRSPQKVYVQLPEEKGSDVNLASYLLLDGLNGDYDEAVVISNDSDLVVPISMVVTGFKKPVGVVNPHPKQSRSADLYRVASWTFQSINRRYFAVSQLPATLSDAQGTINKPAEW